MPTTILSSEELILIRRTLLELDISRAEFTLAERQDYPILLEKFDKIVAYIRLKHRKKILKLHSET